MQRTRDPLLGDLPKGTRLQRPSTSIESLPRSCRRSEYRAKNMRDLLIVEVTDIVKRDYLPRIHYKFFTEFSSTSQTISSTSDLLHASSNLMTSPNLSSKTSCTDPIHNNLAQSTIPRQSDVLLSQSAWICFSF